MSMEPTHDYCQSIDHNTSLGPPLLSCPDIEVQGDIPASISDLTQVDVLWEDHQAYIPTHARGSLSSQATCASQPYTPHGGARDLLRTSHSRNAKIRTNSKIDNSNGRSFQPLVHGRPASPATAELAKRRTAAPASSHRRVDLAASSPEGHPSSRREGTELASLSMSATAGDHKAVVRQPSSTTELPADTAFRTKATTMVDDLLKLYQFGVDLDLLTEDQAAFEHLCAVRRYFAVVSLCIGEDQACSR